MVPRSLRMELEVSRRRRRHTKPKTLDGLERFSATKLGNLRDSISQQISHLEQMHKEYHAMAEEHTKLVTQLRQEHQLIADEISHIRNNPLSRRPGLSRIFYGPYTEEANALLAELEKKRAKLPEIPAWPQYYTVKEYGLHGPASTIAAYLERELSILRAELVKFDRIIERKLKEQQKQTEVRATVAAATGRTREHGYTTRRQIATNHPCPYCGNPLGKKYQADHIYPVAKGGRSTLQNMVNVCTDCNSKKGTMTLVGFIRQYHLKREEIEKRLLELGKEF